MINFKITVARSSSFRDPPCKSLLACDDTRMHQAPKTWVPKEEVEIREEREQNDYFPALAWVMT